jgi:hypothetical protein
MDPLPSAGVDLSTLLPRHLAEDPQRKEPHQLLRRRPLNGPDVVAVDEECDVLASSRL